MNYRKRKQHISQFVNALDLSPLLNLLIEDYGYAALRFLNVLILWSEELDQDSSLVKDKSFNKFRVTVAYDTLEVYLRRYNLKNYSEVFKEKEFLDYFERINRKVTLFVDNTDQIPVEVKLIILGGLRDWFVTIHEYSWGANSNDNSNLDNNINYIDGLMKKYADKKPVLSVSDDDTDSSDVDTIVARKKGFTPKFEDLFNDPAVVAPLLNYLQTDDADNCISTKGDWIKTNTELVAFTKALMIHSFIHNRFFLKEVYKSVTEKFNVKMSYQLWNRKWGSKDKMLYVEPFNRILEDFKVNLPSKSFL